jgi:putative phosphoribosyl transferase
MHSEIAIPLGNIELMGTLRLPPDAQGLVLFAHGSGSSRFSPRNRYVADVLHAHHFGTLLMDLLTPAEEEHDNVTGELRFNIPLLSRRVADTIDWLSQQPSFMQLPLGLFGASTGAAAALVAAATHIERVKAVVSRGGRPDLADDSLPLVLAPTLLIVGENDPEVLALNRQAMNRMTGSRQLLIVPHATHLFEEPGALGQVARNAAAWFTCYLAGQSVAADTTIA